METGLCIWLWCHVSSHLMVPVPNWIGTTGALATPVSLHPLKMATFFIDLPKMAALHLDSPNMAASFIDSSKMAAWVCCQYVLFCDHLRILTYKLFILYVQRHKLERTRVENCMLGFCLHNYSGGPMLHSCHTHTQIRRYVHYTHTHTNRYITHTLQYTQHVRIAVRGVTTQTCAFTHVLLVFLLLFLYTQRDNCIINPYSAITRSLTLIFMLVLPVSVIHSYFILYRNAEIS